MAVLDPKADVLRLLDPQPADGTGPGYISALDVKTVCGNLYDQVVLVNDGLALLPSGSQIQSLVDYVERLERARLQFLATLVGDNFELTPLSLEALQEELVQYLAIPGQTVVNPGSTVVGTGVTDAFTMNTLYSSDIPVSWGNEVVTSQGIGPDKLFWWNGRNFLLVGAVPTDKPNRALVRPNDEFTTADTTDYRVTSPDELLLFLHGDDAAWNAAAPGAKFLIKPVTGTGTILQYHWVPTVGQVPGHFASGTTLLIVGAESQVVPNVVVEPAVIESPVPGGSEYPLPTDWTNRLQVLDWVDEGVPGDSDRAIYALAKHQQAGGSDQVLITVLEEIRDNPAARTAKTAPEPYDADWTVAEVKEWVGDDPARAAEAESQENERSTPRSTLLSWLEPITAAPPV